VNNRAACKRQSQAIAKMSTGASGTVQCGPVGMEAEGRRCGVVRLHPFPKPGVKNRVLLDRMGGVAHLIPPIQYAMNVAFAICRRCNHFVAIPSKGRAARSISLVLLTR